MLYFGVSERLRLEKLRSLVEKDFTPDEKNVGHPHNAYHVIKHWLSARDITEDESNYDKVQNVLMATGLTLPTANDIKGKA